MITFGELQDAVAHGDLFLEYLPTVELASGRCVGAEALSRWRHPEGVISPEVFIPLMEGTPLSGPLTYWVLETAAREVGDLLRRRSDLFLSVNVPPELLGRGGVAASLRHAGITDLARQLVFEITERGVPDQLGIEAIRLAAEAGFKIAIDDAARGGPHMIVMSRIGDVHQVKIDRRFVAHLGLDPTGLDWIWNLAALARTSGVDIVAEGVETAAQAEFLRAAGVGMAQGHYFSHSLPAQELERFVEKQ